MMDYELSAAELRKELPVSWVADDLGLRKAEDGDQYYCPFHDDRSHPNLSEYVAQDESRRYFCFACSARGDALDLLLTVGGLRWPDALAKANRVLRNGQTQGRAVPQPETPADTGPDARALEDARRGLEPYVGTGMLPYAYGLISADSSAPDRAEWDRHLIDRWEWTIDGRGRILIPHRDPYHVLEAVKARSATTREWRCYGSPRGLYGRWLEQQSNVVLLAEGESDTVTADKVLRARVDVRGLPKGAGDGRANPSPDEVARWETTIIAFDNDPAGNAARAAWSQAVPGALHLVLPDGWDLRRVEAAEPGWIRSAVLRLIGSGPA